MKIQLSNGKWVLKSDYIRLKTLDLIEFGYTKLTEDEVSEQVEKILKGEVSLSVIGMICKDDLTAKPE